MACFLIGPLLAEAVAAFKQRHIQQTHDSSQDAELGVSAEAEAAQSAADGQVGRRQVVYALDCLQQLRGQGCPATGSDHRCRAQ